MFLAAYAWPILDVHLDASWKSACRIVVIGAWVVFVVDYLARLGLAQHRGRYWSHHLLDLAVIALPVLRPLRLLRLKLIYEIAQFRPVMPGALLS